MMSVEKSGRYKTEVERNDGRKGKASASDVAKPEKHLEIYGGYSEGIGKKTYSHGPMDFAKMLKVRFRVLIVGDLDLPERRKEVHQ